MDRRTWQDVMARLVGGTPVKEQPVPAQANLHAEHKDPVLEAILAGAVLSAEAEQRLNVTVDQGDSPEAMSAFPLRSRLNRTVRLERGRISLQARIRVEGPIREVGAPLDVSDPAELTKLESKAADRIARSVTALMERLQELNVDAIGVGELVRQQMPAVWQRMEPVWHEGGFREARLVPNVTVQLGQTGLITYFPEPRD